MQYEMKWRVQYYETDRMGIVHHSNYSKYFETARTEFIRDAGMPYERIEELGIYIPVIGVRIDYMAGAVYDEILSLACRLTKLSHASFELEYEVKNTGTGRLHAKGWSRQAFTDRTFRPVVIRKAAPEIYEVFRKIYEDGKQDEA